MAWKQLYGILPFFVSSLLALSLALTYKLLKRRLSRRSPLASKQIGHVPGQQLVTRMSDHQTDMNAGAGEIDVPDGARTSIKLALIDDNGPNGSYFYLDDVLPW